MAKEPKTMRRQCRIKHKEIVIVYDRENGNDYCSAQSACDKEECKYEGGIIDPFEE